MNLFYFLAQTFSVDPTLVKAIEEAGIAIVALVAMVASVIILARIILKSLTVLDKNTAALDKITDRIIANQDRDEREKERTRSYIETTGDTIDKMKNAVLEVQLNLSKQIEDSTAPLIGSDGVLARLKTSISQISDLGIKTQSVVDSANNISQNLEYIKEAVGKMSASDDDVKDRIVAIQDQLKALSGAVSSIPAAVGDAERNIIAVIERRTSDTRPLPDVTQIVISAPNGALEKEKGNEQSPQAPQVDD